MIIVFGLTFFNYQNIGEQGHNIIGHISYYKFRSKAYNLLSDQEERKTHIKLGEHIEHQVPTIELIEKIDFM